MALDADTTADHDPTDDDLKEVLDKIAELVLLGNQIDGRTLKLQFPQHSYQYNFVTVTDFVEAATDEPLPQTNGYIRQEEGKQTVPFRFDGQRVAKLRIPAGFGPAMACGVSRKGDVLTGMACVGRVRLKHVECESFSGVME